MPTSRITTDFRGAFAPHAVPARELYGAFLESWRTREIAEAQFNLARFSAAVRAERGEYSEVLVHAREADRLLSRRAIEGSAVDDMVAEVLVLIKRALDEGR